MNERRHGTDGDWDGDGSWNTGDGVPPGGPYEGPSSLQGSGDQPWFAQEPGGDDWGGDADAQPTRSFPVAGGVTYGDHPADAGPSMYGTQGYGEPAAEPGRSGGAQRVIVPLLVVAILAVLGIGGYLVYTTRKDSNGSVASPPSSSTSSGTAAASTTQESPSDEPATESSAESSDSGSAPSRVSSPPRTSAAPASTQPDSSHLPAGLTPHGWTGHITCNADDTWVYAGGNGSDYAVICTATPGGGLYYRGQFDGGEAEHDVAEYTLGSSPSFHTVPAGDTSIYINGDHLTVFGAGNAVLAETTFTTALVR